MTQSRMDLFTCTSTILPDNVQGIISFFNHRGLTEFLMERPLSYWNNKNISKLLQELGKSLPQNRFYTFSPSVQKITGISIHFKLDEKPGIIKILKDTVEAQVLLGQMWQWMYKQPNLVILILDPGKFFNFSYESLPPNLILWMIPTRLLENKTESNNSKFKPENFHIFQSSSVNDSGYLGYEILHPQKNAIEAKLEHFLTHSSVVANFKHFHSKIYQNNQENRDDKRLIEGIFNILDTFPIGDFFNDPAITGPIKAKDGRIREIYVEWILSEILHQVCPNLFINQYRFSETIRLDFYFPNCLIIEFKCVSNQSDLYRSIGQIWTYARLRLPIILYIYDPNQKIRNFHFNLPKNCQFLVKSK